VDELIESASATVDADKRLQYMREAQKIALVGDQAFIPLHYQVDLYAKANKVAFEPRADHYFWYADMNWQ
jgi:peptide/nickel transport system substrate-binding protein